MIIKNLVKNNYHFLKILFLFTFSWSLCFIVPHFQSQFNSTVVITHLCIVILLSTALYQLLLIDNDRNNVLSFFIILSFSMIYIGSLLITLLDKAGLYFFINRFGAGSMYQNNKVYLFSDLTHLTSASSCSIPVKIGENICDPFSRVFNQNPHVVEFLKLLGFSNLFLAGFISTLLFWILILIIYFKKYISAVVLTLVLLSPPVILALDRGNEIITLLLILPGLYLIKRNLYSQIIGVLLLSVASVFKLWPLVLLISVLIFSWKHLCLFSKVIVCITILYWTSNIQNSFSMLNSTQKGNPFGLSFGLRHYFNSSIFWPYLIIFIIAILFSTIYIVTKFKSIRAIDFDKSFDRSLFNSLITTYVAIWFTGDSYVYRLVLLIPVLIFLRKVFTQLSARTLLESLIVATMLTTKLSVTTVMTGTLSLIFILILAYQKLNSKEFTVVT